MTWALVLLHQITLVNVERYPSVYADDMCTFSRTAYLNAKKMCDSVSGTDIASDTDIAGSATPRYASPRNTVPKHAKPRQSTPRAAPWKFIREGTRRSDCWAMLRRKQLLLRSYCLLVYIYTFLGWIPYLFSSPVLLYSGDCIGISSCFALVACELRWVDSLMGTVSRMCVCLCLQCRLCVCVFFTVFVGVCVFAQGAIVCLWMCL